MCLKGCIDGRKPVVFAKSCRSGNDAISDITRKAASAQLRTYSARANIALWMMCIRLLKPPQVRTALSGGNSYGDWMACSSMRKRLSKRRFTGSMRMAVKAMLPPSPIGHLRTSRDYSTREREREQTRSGHFVGLVTRRPALKRTAANHHFLPFNSSGSRPESCLTIQRLEAHPQPLSLAEGE